MSERKRLKNGKFVKRKIFYRNAKGLAASIESRARKRKENEDVNKTITEGKRIVELSTLGKNVRCRDCNNVLSLENTIKEKQIGIHSISTVLCDKCKMSSAVNTEIVENDISHINAFLILGAIHTGAGSTALNKILACANIPPISNNTYKRYEKIVSEAVEREGKESCKRATEEERVLVFKYIKKLCDKL